MHGAGYTRFVRLSKFLLPVTALVICGVVITRMSQSPVREIEAVPAHEKTAAGESTLLKAQYEGVDADGRPYTLIAERAWRAPDSDDAILLEKLEADIVLKDGAWLAVHATAGSYAAKAARLELSSGVRVFHDSGYELAMEAADIDLKGRTAVSQTPVRAQGPMGEIAAQSLEVKDAGNLVVFGGPVTMTLYGLKGAG